MKTTQKVKAASLFLRSLLFKQKIPIAIRWQLTNSCDCRCLFCNLYNEPVPLPKIPFIESVIDQLAAMGTVRISFSGGEPLLRPDIGHIISYAKSRGISPTMNTNGIYIPDVLDKLKDIDLLKITVHGPPEAHNKIQGGLDMFTRVMEGVEAAHRVGLPFSFALTVTKYNVKHLDFVVDLAEKYNTFVAIQPLKSLYRGIENIDHIAPAVDDYQKALDKLIERKVNGNPHIRNTLMGLKHIRHWPDYPDLSCTAGKMFAIIETNGDVKPCDRITYDTQLPNLHDMTMVEAWRSLPRNLNCTGCGFCGALELNFAYQVKSQAIFAINKLLRT